MKNIFLIFVLLGISQSALVNATLLGRVNAYYSQKTGEAVNKATKEYDVALQKLRDARAASDKNKNDIKLAADDVEAKLMVLESAKDKTKPASADEINMAQKVYDKALEKQTVLKAKKIELEKEAKEEEENAKVKMLDLEVAKKEIVFGSPDDDSTGVKTGVGPVSFTNTLGKEVNAVSFNAYKLNLLLWQAECKQVLDEKDNPLFKADGTPVVAKTNLKDYLYSNFKKDAYTKKSCPADSTMAYKFIPVYFFLHQTTAKEISNDSLISDLLDNEHGGLINIKFTPTLTKRSTSTADGKPLPTNWVVMFDLGPKYIEAPSLADPKATTYVGAGYMGFALNFEFGLYDTQIAVYDIVTGSKPQGGMAIGFGVYRNWVDSGGFNNSSFISQIPNTYSTYVIGYEFQVTNLIAISGTRSIPAESDTLGILGTYSSISVKYNF